MLQGRKPVASFLIEGEPESPLRYLRMFDRHVQLGRFSKREMSLDSEDQRLRRILYAAVGEEWRIEALLRHYEAGHGWSVESERKEGSLLGYADWEIEAWLEHLHRHGLLRTR